MLFSSIFLIETEYCNVACDHPENHVKQEYEYLTHISLEKYSSLLTPGTSHSYLVFHISDSEEYVIRGGWNGSALDSDVVIEAGVPMNVSEDNLGLTISERYAGVSSDGKTPAGMRLHITDMDPDSIWLLMTNFVNKLDSALEANGNGYTAWDTNCNFVTAHVLYSVGIDPNSIQDDNGDRFIGWTNLEGWTPPDIPLYAFDYQMSGTSSSDRMFGNGGIQTFDGGGGDDTFYGGGGSDTIYGRSGNDRFYISMGQDTIEGGAGHDTINVRNPEYFYDEHLTFDDSTINQFVEIIGSLRSDGTIAIAVSEAKSEKSAVASSIEAIVASDGCDFIYVDHAWHGHVSDPGVIAVNGAGGSDVIKGSSGRDWLIGGSGSDRLYGDDVGEVYKPFAPLSGEGNWLSGGVGDTCTRRWMRTPTQ